MQVKQHLTKQDFSIINKLFSEWKADTVTVYGDEAEVIHVEAIGQDYFFMKSEEYEYVVRWSDLPKYMTAKRQTMVDIEGYCPVKYSLILEYEKKYM